MDNDQDRGVGGHSVRIVAVLLLTIMATAVESAAAATGVTLSPAQEWALATSALLTSRNRERHDILGGVGRTPGNAERARKLLAEWWGTRTRDDLIGSLQWVETEGHRTRFAEMGQELSRASSDEVAALVRHPRMNEERRRQVNIVMREHDRLGSKGLLGWDYARYVSLCRWGYVAGYLSEDEAWPRIMKAARVLQQTFGSWRDLGENYLIGREFWSPSQTATNGHLYEETFQRLLSDPQSPWIRLPWKTPLGEP